MSYSSLGDHSVKDIDVTGDDANPIGDSGPISAESAPFAEFPGGNLSGSCVHEILEELDLGAVTGVGWQGWADSPDIRTLIERKLLQYGRVRGRQGTPEYVDEFTTRYGQICDMLHRTLTTPLRSGRKSLALNQLGDSYLPELEFYMRVTDSIDLQRLNGFLQNYGRGLLGHSLDTPETIDLPTLLRKGTRGATRGMLNGLIDLVFEHRGKYYFLDWKTTRIGSGTYGDYTPRHIAANMLETGYMLQFCLYAIAVHRMLGVQTRRGKKPYDYARHFGGGFYIYVRGMNGVDDTTGVFFHKPDAGALQELADILPFE